MNFSYFAVLLMICRSVHSHSDAAPFTRVVTKFVFTCPCDATSTVSFGTTYPTSDANETDWGSGILTSTTSTIASGSSSSISDASNSTTTTSSSNTATSTTTTTTTTTTSTTTSFVIEATTGASKLAKRANLYLAFNSTGYGFLVGSQSQAQPLTNDGSGNLITATTPTQYVGFTSTNPQLLELFSTPPGAPVTVTINSDGSLTISNVSSQCDDNTAGDNEFVVVQNGGTTPANCISLTLSAQNYVPVSYSSTCSTRTTVSPTATVCTTVAVSGGTTGTVTTVCSSSTSTTVFAPGTTGTAKYTGCTTITGS